MAKNVLKRPLLKKVVRGYSPEQVDMFVRRAIDRVATLGRENDSLRQRLSDALSEIEKLKADRDRNAIAALAPEDGEAARAVLTEAAESLLAIAKKFEAVDGNTAEEEPDEIPAEETAGEPEDHETAASGTEEDVSVDGVVPEDEDVSDDDGSSEEKADGGEFPFSDDVGDGAEEVFYEEEIGETDESPAEELTETEEEDEVEIVEDILEETEEEIRENVTEEAAEAAPETDGQENEPEKEQSSKNAEDDALLARLKEVMSSDGPDFPDDPLTDPDNQNGGVEFAGKFEDYSLQELLHGVLANTPEEAEASADETAENGETAAPPSPDDLDFYNGEEHADGEDFDPSSLIRRNRPGRDIDKK